MCLYIKGIEIDPRIAKEDIPIYKVLQVQFHNRKIQLVSPYYEMKYKIGKTYKTEMKSNPYDSHEINEGFHSFIGYIAAINEIERIAYPTIIVNGIIPKGSSYYLGENQDIVSNKIKLTGF